MGNKKSRLPPQKTQKELDEENSPTVVAQLERLINDKQSSDQDLPTAEPFDQRIACIHKRTDSSLITKFLKTVEWFHNCPDWEIPQLNYLIEKFQDSIKTWKVAGDEVIKLQRNIDKIRAKIDENKGNIDKRILSLFIILDEDVRRIKSGEAVKKLARFREHITDNIERAHECISEFKKSDLPPSLASECIDWDKRLSSSSDEIHASFGELESGVKKTKTCVEKMEIQIQILDTPDALEYLLSKSVSVSHNVNDKALQELIQKLRQEIKDGTRVTTARSVEEVEVLYQQGKAVFPTTPVAGSIEGLQGNHCNISFDDAKTLHEKYRHDPRPDGKYTFGFCIEGVHKLAKSHRKEARKEYYIRELRSYAEVLVKFDGVEGATMLLYLSLHSELPKLSISCNAQIGGAQMSGSMEWVSPSGRNLSEIPSIRLGKLSALTDKLVIKYTLTWHYQVKAKLK